MTNMRNLNNLMWVARMMPEECALALDRFVRVNPSYNGANWEDCLDILLDSDAHLEVTEPIYEEIGALYEDKSSFVAVTLLWAYGGVPTADEVRAVLQRTNVHGNVIDYGPQFDEGDE
jgi:hypothetical protein